MLLLSAIFLAGALRAEGKGLAGLEAGREGYAQSCAREYAAFQRSIEERRARENPVYDKIARILRRHAVFTGITDEDNEDFLALARLANAGEKSDAVTFLMSENAVLKELNDKAIRDKDLVTALTNIRKEVETRAFEKDPELEKHWIASNSDFKVLHYALDTKDPAVLRKMNQVMRDVNERYAAYLASVGEEKGWVEKGSTLARDARTWFQSGYGASPDEAALAARQSRALVAAGQAPRVLAFTEIAEGLAQAARKATLYRGWVEKRFAGVNGFLTTSGSGKKILSAETIETLKKAAPPAASADEALKAMGAALKARFGIDLSSREVGALSAYVDLADRFSPPLLLGKRTVIDLGKNAAGVISADFKGQGARNIEETMRSLADSDGMTMAQRIMAVRAGEKRATDLLEEKKDRFRKVLALVVPGGKAEFSGDDGIGFLARPLTRAEKENFFRLWLEKGGDPSDLRLTFDSFTHANTGTVLAATARSGLVVGAEGVEKDLRGALIATVPREKLNGLQILVTAAPNEGGAPSVAVHLGAVDGVPESTIQRVRELLAARGFPGAPVDAFAAKR